MSSERNERKWVQYVNAYGQKSDWSEPPSVSVDAADVRSMAAKDEVTNYFILMEAAEKHMRAMPIPEGQMFYDSVIVETPNPTESVVAMIESLMNDWQEEEDE